MTTKSSVKLNSEFSLNNEVEKYLPRLKRILQMFSVLCILTLLPFQKVMAQTNFTWFGASGGSWANVNNWWLGGNTATMLPGQFSGFDDVGYGDLGSTNDANNNPIVDNSLANTVTNGFQTLDQDFAIDGIFIEGPTNPVTINGGIAPHTITLGNPSDPTGHNQLIVINSSLTFDTNVTIVLNDGLNSYVAGTANASIDGTLDVDGYAFSLIVAGASSFCDMSGILTNSFNNTLDLHYEGDGGAQLVVSGQIVGGSGGFTWDQVAGGSLVIVTNNGSIIPFDGAVGNDWTMANGSLILLDNAIVGTGTGNDGTSGDIDLGAYTIDVTNNAQLLRGAGALNLNNTSTINQNGGTVGNVGAGDITLNNASIYNLYAGLLLSSGDLDITNSSTFNFDGGAIELGADAQIVALDAAANFIVESGGVILAGAGSSDYSFNSPLQHYAAITTDGGFLAASGGSVQLNAANTYNGPTIVTNGTDLILGNPNALENSTLVFTVAGGGAVQFASGDVLGGLAGDKDIVLPQSLTIGNNNQNTIYSGILSGSGASLVKVGTGTLTLDGPNSYNGSTLINSGVLSLTSASTGGGAYSVAGGAALGVELASAGASLSLPSLALNSGSMLTLDASSFGNPTAPIINVMGSLSSAGTVTLNITGTALTTGSFPLIKYGSLGGSGFSAFAPHMQLPLGFGGTATLVNDAANDTIDVNITVQQVINVATSLAISQEPSSAATAGVPFANQPVLTVLDQFGNPLTSSSAAIAASITGGGVLNGSNATVSATAVNGVATFSGLFATAAGNITLTFSSSGVASTNSSHISIGANSLSRLIWVTQPGLATNGFVLGQSPVLETADAYGNPTQAGLPASALVQVSIASGGGTLSGTVTNDIGTAAGNGTLVFSNLVLSATGTLQLIASDIGSVATPTNILEATNCQLWLDASDLSTLILTNGTVVTWSDKSGKTNNATSGVSPIFTTNSVSLVQGAAGMGRVVRFDGSTTSLNINLSSLGLSPYTIMVVEVANNPGGNAEYFIGQPYGGNSGLTGYLDGTLGSGYQSPTEWRWQQYADDLNYDTTFTFPAVHVVTEVMDSTTNQNLYFDSSLEGTRQAGNFLTGVGTLPQSTVGSAGYGNFYSGDIAELIVYNTGLNDTDRANLESYLMAKWTKGLAGATSAGFSVVSTNGTSGTGPAIQSVIFNNNNSSINVSGTGGPSNGGYRILTSTNLIAPLATWIPIATNSFSSSGTFISVVPVNNKIPAAFYRLAVP